MHWGAYPRIMRFELGRPVQADESRQLEFKTVSSKNPVRTIADLCDMYTVAFLNSSGGKIFWGIRDHDKVVEGVTLNDRQRDELRRVIMDKLNAIEPKIDPTRFQLDLSPLSGDLFVVGLTVPRGTGGPFYAAGKHAYVRLDGVNKLLSGPQLTAWITERNAKRRQGTPAEAVRIEVYYHGEQLPLDMEVRWDFRAWTYTRPSMVFDFHRPSASEGKHKQKFGIVTSSFFTAIADGWSRKQEPIVLPDGRHLFTDEKMILTLMPGAWHKYSLTGDFREHVVNRREEMAFRFFTDSGPIDMPFAARMLGTNPKIGAEESRRMARWLKELEQGLQG